MVLLVLLVLMFGASAGGCGQKGPLILPATHGAPAPAVSAASAPTR
jgi:predicted small lipoprotein YifL